MAVLSNNPTTTMNILAIIFVSVLLSIAVILREYFKPTDKKWSFSSRRWKLPPGPPPAPVVGNLLQLFSARKSGRLVPYLTSLTEYGEMTTLRMGSRTWIMLNSDRVVSEIIAKRAKITNERPHMPIAGGLVSHNKRAVIRRAEPWVESRRVMHHLLSGSNLKQYGKWQEAESETLLLSYLKDPQAWYTHHFRYATAVLHRVVMGGELTKTQAELDDYQQVTMDFVNSLHSSSIDFFPQLERLPKLLQLWRGPWERMGQFHHRVFQDWWRPIKAAIWNGTAPPSFVRDVLLHPDIRYKGDDEEAMYLATSIMAAGGDNARMVMNTFVMAMISHPETFQRAREEVDRVCGRAERLPNLEDMSAMPYVCGIVKEVLRWRPTVPVVPPHELTEDLEFEGYNFPRGTEFLVNTSALCNQFKNPGKFLPERWLDGNQDNVLHGFWGFGGGRRVCVGYKVAQQTVFVAVSRLIQCFDFLPSGPVDSYKLNHFTLTEPFPVNVTVRGDEYEKLIMSKAQNWHE